MIIVIIFQVMLFSLGMNFNKKLIRFSALAVYFGMLLFFFAVFLSDVKLTYSAFLNALNFNNFSIIKQWINQIDWLDFLCVMKHIYPTHQYV